MQFIKIGEFFEISSDNLKNTDNILLRQDVIDNFSKFASGLKTLAPRAKDFLYFSAIMMHAAEAALLDDNGKIKKDSSGKDVTAHWEKKGESVKWICSDYNIKPYRNKNRDIFPESQLIIAHKKWVGKPLCLDHQSDSVDKIRGLIVDTFYDAPFKRVIALCALDKINYPDLARKVATGYAASVSMGTAVGRAICSDCGTVAKVEADFCDCMRNKRCYGEINEDLNPIELSLVVNGADEKAKIKNIIASANDLKNSANHLENYLTNKENYSDSQNSSKNLEQLKQEFQSLANKISVLEKEASLSNNNSLPEDWQDYKVYKIAMSDINQKLHQMEEHLKKISETKETIFMSEKKAYLQGAGGDNEPAPPGQVKYTKEEADNIRNTQDKQQGGQMNMGPVDGMHPGYESYGESDEVRKKRLQRLAAEQDERKLRRVAALKVAEEARKEELGKVGYFQGGGEGNEPELGKTKYTVDPTGDKLRVSGDKQQTGSPPFPNVGKVDGLYGDDEAAKKKVLRATLVQDRALDGSLNPKTSYWKFDQGSQTVSASIAEIAKGKSENYPYLITKDFAKKVLANIKSQGIGKVANILKQAQALTDMSGGSETAEMPASPATVNSESFNATDAVGKTGDPTETIDQSLSAISNAVADLRHSTESLTNEVDGGSKAVTEELPPGGEALLPPATAELVTAQKTLSKWLLSASKEATAALLQEVENLKIAKNIYRKGTKHLDSVGIKELEKVTVDSIKTANQHLADTHAFLSSFNKYVKGTENLIVKANQEITLVKKAQFAASGLPGDPLDPTLNLQNTRSTKIPTFTGPTKKPVSNPKDTRELTSPEEMTQLLAARPNRDLIDRSLQAGSAASPARSGSTQVLTPSNFNTSANAGQPDTHQADDKEKDCNEKDKDCNKADDQNDIKVKMNQDGTMDVPQENLKDLKAAFDLTTFNGRTQYRAKLAEKAEKVSGGLMDLINQAHPGGGYTFKTETKSTGDLGKIERIDETHKAMMDFAERPVVPATTKKKAEKIQELIVSGSLKVSDLEKFEKQGSVDAEAVKYWKAFYGQIKDGGSQFAADLLKDQSGAKKAAAKEIETFQVKFARSYSLANEMVKKGQCEDNETAVRKEVDNIMKFTDEGYESVKKMVNRLPSLDKTASSLSLPNVGLFGGNQMLDNTPPTSETNLIDLFSGYFNRPGKKF